MLDILAILASVLFGVSVAFGPHPPALVAIAVGLLLGFGALWITWRRRRQRRHASIGVAICIAVVAFGMFILADSPMSMGVLWLAVLVLTFEAGIPSATAVAVAVTLFTLGAHVAVGSGAARAIGEGLGAALIMAVGIELAALLRRAEAIDRERLAALDGLEQANAELRRRQSLEQDLAIADERARIATALHDGLGHRLTAIGLTLDAAELQRARDPERADAANREARGIASAALDEMRRVVRAMHPVEAGGDVAASIEAVARSFDSTGLWVEFERTGDVPVDGEQGLVLLRFVQEGLTNVVRHSGARRAIVRLEQGRCGMRAAIADDGRAERGTSRVDAAAPVNEGFGLRTLRERAAALGGSLEVDPTGGIDGGFRVALSVPARTAPEVSA